MVYLPLSALPTHQVLFTVSRKKVSSAVARNKLKRRMREAYRLSKHCLTDRAGVYFLIGYIYTGTEKSCDFKTVQAKIVASLHYLNKLYRQDDRDSLQA
jgi:ribonuclease P protein component